MENQKVKVHAVGPYDLTKPRTTVGWKLEKRHCETPKGVSMTVPDDSYSIKELVIKYAGNIDPAVSLLSNYDGEDDEVDIDDVAVSSLDRLDPAEQDQILSEAKEKQAAIKARFEQQKAAKQTPEKERETVRGSRKYQDDDGGSNSDTKERQGGENTPKRRNVQREENGE